VSGLRLGSRVLPDQRNTLDKRGNRLTRDYAALALGTMWRVKPARNTARNARQAPGTCTTIYSLTHTKEHDMSTTAPVTHEITLADLSTEELRSLSGKVLQELKRRAKANKPTAAVVAHGPGTAPATPKPEKQAKVHAAPRPFGVCCPSTGKVLKRSYETEAEALAACAELAVSMKREYTVMTHTSA
jgi:hypothetical protein